MQKFRKRKRPGFPGLFNGLNYMVLTSPAAAALWKNAHNEGADERKCSTNHQCIEWPCKSHDIASSWKTMNRV